MTPKFPDGKLGPSKIPDGNKAPTMEKAGGVASGDGRAGKAVRRLHDEVHREAPMKDWRCED